MTTQGDATAKRSVHVAEAPSAWGRSIVGEVPKLCMSVEDVCDILASFVAITGNATQITVFEDNVMGIRVLFRCETYEVDR